MELIIDRSKWIRGAASDDTWLLRARDGHMCCLGFYALACGLTEDQIRNVPGPLDAFPNGISSDDNDNCFINTPGEWLLSDIDRARLISYNDDSHVSDQEREEKITKIFAKHGVTVKFV
jgi:hypothetical protein